MYLYLNLVIILAFHHGVHGLDMEMVSAFATLLKQKIIEMAVETFNEGANKVDEVLRFMADTVVATTLMGCVLIIPNTFDIPPLDLDVIMGGPSHLTTGMGHISGLSSVVSLPIKYEKSNNGDLLVTLPLTFKKLQIIYRSFKLDNWPIVLRGTSKLTFTDGAVNMNIRLARPADILVNIINKRCVFHVSSIKFSGFNEMEAKIILEKDKDRKFLYDHVFPVVAGAIKRMLLHVIDVRVTNSLYDTLPASDSWVCRDPELHRLTVDTTGPVKFTPAGIANWLPESPVSQDNAESSEEFITSHQIKELTESALFNFDHPA